MEKKKKLKMFTQTAIKSVKDLIDNEPLQPRGIHELATKAGISRNVMQQGFRQLFATSIKKYQQKKRLEAATFMLNDGQLTIKQISVKLGYRSQSNFSTAFKNIYGITPMEWQHKTLNTPSN